MNGSNDDTNWKIRLKDLTIDARNAHTHSGAHSTMSDP